MPCTVSTHSRLKAAGLQFQPCHGRKLVSTHSRLKAAGEVAEKSWLFRAVSTHSRLKAAGVSNLKNRRNCRCFNTQPPEGGWDPARPKCSAPGRFNTQPPEGGWPARHKAARPPRGFNTQPPEGGWTFGNFFVNLICVVSTHSRLKAAGPCTLPSTAHTARFNTQPPEGGWACGLKNAKKPATFQHTAA